MHPRRSLTQATSQFFAGHLFIVLACAAAMAGLAGDVPALIVLLLAAAANYVLGRYVQRPRLLQPRVSHRVQLLYREISVQSARIVFALWAVLLVLAAATSLSFSSAALFAAAIAAAALPVGLPGLLAWLQETGPRTDTPRSVQPITQATLGSLAPSWSALCLILWSLLGAVIFHVSLGISVPLLIVLDVVVATLCLGALRYDPKQPGAKASRQWPHGALFSRSSAAELFWTGVMAGGLAYVNFMLFFWRRGLSPEYVAPGSQVHGQASAVAFATLSLCIVIHFLQRRSPAGLFSRTQFKNYRLWLSIGGAALIGLCVVYSPWVAPYFQSGPFELADGSFVLAAALVFIITGMFEQHTRRHSRSQLLARHHPAKIKKHLGLV